MSDKNRSCVPAITVDLNLLFLVFTQYLLTTRTHFWLYCSRRHYSRSQGLLALYFKILYGQEYMICVYKFSSHQTFPAITVLTSEQLNVVIPQQLETKKNKKRILSDTICRVWSPLYNCIFERD
jgi:hypothetical protein